jgi:F0F1-type ATP synthase membrane subunit b/b'
VKGYIAPSIESLISLRDGKIESDLNEATKARGKALELREQYETARKKVHSKISEMLEGELTNFNRITSEQASKINADIAILSQKAEEEISVQKAKYKEELEQVVLDYSSFLIHRVSGLQPNKEELKNYRG